MNNLDFLSKSKIYKMRLVTKERSIFGEYVDSENKELFIKAMEDDLHKIKQITLDHPKQKDVFGHKYMLCPANGNTLMSVGKFKDPMDFAYVFIVFNSKKYRDPYLVVQRYSKVCRNPDTLAGMLVSAYNTVLSDKGVEINIEPWNVIDTPFWYVEDGWESWNIELFNTQGRNLIRKGYEDALEIAKKEAEEADKKPICKKSDDIRVYIKPNFNKDVVLKFLHHAVKGMKAPKEIAMPFRFLYDHDITEHIPYKAVLREFPELKDRITEKRYNDWTNKMSTSYDNDDHYKTLEGIFEMILY